MFSLNGSKNLTLEAQEVALVLDALSLLPYNRVVVLINKIVEQARDRDPTPEAEPVRQEPSPAP